MDLDESSEFEPSPSSSLFLPFEIKDTVVQFLFKSDLKTLRHVNRQWSTAATPLLFDRVYASLRDKDLEVFREITTHPVLRHSIKEFICDASRCIEASFRQYFDMLCRQTFGKFRWLCRNKLFRGPNPRLNQLVNELNEGKKTKSQIYDDYCNDDLITEGYRFVQALFVEECNNKAKFLLDLHSGLCKLPNLQVVTIDDVIWVGDLAFLSSHPADTLKPYHVLQAVHTGPPLARSWNTWHLLPRRLNDEFNELSEYFDIILGALSSAERRPKEFKYSSHNRSGLSPKYFIGEAMIHRVPQLISNALCQLQRLELEITPRADDLIDHHNVNILGYLPQMLDGLHGLRELYLDLRTEKIQNGWQTKFLPQIQDELYTYSQVLTIEANGLSSNTCPCLDSP